jgi:hypothetical protein
MKTLTLCVPDDLYERAERRAAERGETLAEFVGDLLKQSIGPVVSDPRRELAALFAALNKRRARTLADSADREELSADPCILVGETRL